jgi:endonuclease YncB( thermonuclease family)
MIALAPVNSGVRSLFSGESDYIMNRKSILLTCLFLLIHSSSGLAQDTKSKAPLPVLSLETPCGNPLEQSDAYFHPIGWKNLLVTKVIDGRTILVLLPNGARKRMKLGGIDVPKIKSREGIASLRYLSGIVFGKRVTLLLHSVSDEDKTLGGRVSLETSPFDVNQAMIESGMARYKESEYLTSFDNCMYKLSAEKAQKEKKGLWQSYFNR